MEVEFYFSPYFKKLFLHSKVQNPSEISSIFIKCLIPIIVTMRYNETILNSLDELYAIQKLELVKLALGCLHKHHQNDFNIC